MVNGQRVHTCVHFSYIFTQERRHKQFCRFQLSVLAEMVAVEVSSEFGYVALVAAGSWGLNFWQMMKVGKARKALNVEYPKMYSEDKPLFNCVMVIQIVLLEANIAILFRELIRTLWRTFLTS